MTEERTFDQSSQAVNGPQINVAGDLNYEQPDTSPVPPPHQIPAPPRYFTGRDKDLDLLMTRFDLGEPRRALDCVKAAQQILEQIESHNAERAQRTRAEQKDQTIGGGSGLPHQSASWRKPQPPPLLLGLHQRIVGLPGSVREVLPLVYRFAWPALIPSGSPRP